MKSFSNQKGDSQWLPISDLMSVLMMVFIIISVFYMLLVKKDQRRIEEIAITYNTLQKDLYDELKLEFKDDLNTWNAEIDSIKLSIRFIAPDNDLNTTSPRIFLIQGALSYSVLEKKTIFLQGF